jgi:methyl-accepting chemotaxis protein
MSDALSSRSPRRGIGLRGELLVAVGGIAALVLVACGVGIASYGPVGARLHDITRKSMPQIAKARQLAESSALIVAAVPVLDGAGSQDERNAVFADLAERGKALTRLIDDLGTLGFAAERTQGLRTRTGQLVANLDRQNALVEKRLGVEDGRRKAVSALSAAHAAYLGVLDPRIEAETAALGKTAAATVAQSRTGIETLSTQSLDVLTPAHKLRALVGETVEAAGRAALVREIPKEDDDLDLAVFRRNVTAANTMLVKLQMAGVEMPGLKDAVDAIFERGDGEQGVFALRARAHDSNISASDREAAQAGLKRAVEAMGAFRDTALGAIDPLLSNVQSKLTVTGVRLKRDIDQSVNALVGTGVARLRVFLELAAAGNLSAGLVNEAAATAEPQALDALAGRATKAEKTLAALLDKLPAEGDGAEIRPAVQALLAAAAGETSPIPQRRSELAALAEGAALLAQSREIAAGLSRDVTALVADAERDGEAGAALAEATIASSRFSLILLAAASVVLAGLVVWLYVGRRIVNRLVRMTAAMDELAGGNLDVTVDIGGPLQIQAMGRNLMVFRETAQARRDAEARAEAERAEASAARRAALRELAEDFEARLMGIVSLVGRTSADMQATAERMGAFVRRTIASVASATDAARAASHNVETIAAATEELSASVREIGDQATQSASIAGGAVDIARTTNTTVESLVGASQRIGEVLTLIHQVAEQTNLLALNATIEAARAGDAGKGFAVVAGEVKSLASQTERATDDIARQIDQVRRTTQETAEAMGRIGTAIDDVERIATAIAGAVEEQGAATVEIARNVHLASDGTNKVSTDIDAVRTVADETDRAAGAVLDAASVLAAQGRELSAEIERFMTRMRA